MSISNRATLANPEINRNGDRHGDPTDDAEDVVNDAHLNGRDPCSSLHERPAHPSFGDERDAHATANPRRSPHHRGDLVRVQSGDLIFDGEAGVIHPLEEALDELEVDFTGKADIHIHRGARKCA